MATLLHVFMALSAIVYVVVAVPNVTVAPLPNTCPSYPNFHNITGEAGPWLAYADQTDRPDMDDFRVTAIYATAVGNMRWGFIGIPAGEQSADIRMRCVNDTLQANLDMGALGRVWQPVVIATTPGEKALGFGFPELPDPTVPVEIYNHVVDGETQAGVFIGAGNVTTWGFNWINDTESGTGEYYYLRLLGPGTDSRSSGKPLNDGEFTGFIRIAGS